MDSLSLEKEKIAKRMAKLEMKERLLREKERKHHTRHLIQLGELIHKAQIDHLDPETLLGALQEIKDRCSSQESIQQWKEKGQAHLTETANSQSQPLIISLCPNLTDEIISILRKQKFKWNRFRNEWYGHGKIDDIRQCLKGQTANVEIANTTN